MVAEQDWSEQTAAVRGGLARSGFDETAEAIYATSGYVYPSAAEAEAAFAGELDRFIYSRYGNPTVAMFEERLRLIEGAEACLATASGMSAIYSALASLVNAGDKVVSSKALFGSCHVIIAEILPRMGVETVQVDGGDLEQWTDALAGGAKAVFFETPSNPGLEIIDIAAVSKLAHEAGAIVMVDNVFASPVLQRPLQQGADVVMYSATKHIDGQGRTLGGAVLGSEKFIRETLMPFTRHTGPSLSPFNAWVLVKGLETMSLRVNAECDTAEYLVQALHMSPALTRVSYPNCALARSQMKRGGTILTIDVAGGKQAAFEFMDALKVWDISNNVGDAKSLVTHPATTTHRRLGPEGRAAVGIGDGLVRLSVGLEDRDDLLSDVQQALASVRT